jgi:hypothetical protein
VGSLLLKLPAPAPRFGRTKTISTSLAVLSVICLWQLVLGCSPLVLSISVLTGIVGLVPVRIYGFKHVIGGIFLFTAGLFSLNGLIIKSVYAQPIDSHLFQPLLSFTVALAGVSAFAAGATVAAPLALRFKGLLKNVVDPAQLRILALISLFIGLSSNAMVLALQEGLVANGIRFFVSFTILGIICETAREILLSGGQRTISTLSLIAISLALALSLAANAKSGFVFIGAAYFITCISFSGMRSVLVRLVVSVLIFLFLEKYVFTAIHLARASRGEIDPIAVLDITLSYSWGLLINDINVLADVRAGMLEYIRSDPLLYQIHYFTDDYVSIGAIDRFMLVPFIDAIIRDFSLNGPFLGVQNITDRFFDFLPVTLNYNKVYTDQSDVIAWTLGLIPEESLGLVTITLPAELFIYGGLQAVMIIGSLVFCIAALILSLSAPSLNKNVFGIFLLVTIGGFLPTTLFLSTEVLLLRTLPTILLTSKVLVVIISWMCRKPVRSDYSITGNSYSRVPTLSPLER